MRTLLILALVPVIMFAVTIPALAVPQHGGFGGGAHFSGHGGGHFAGPPAGRFDGHFGHGRFFVGVPGYGWPYWYGYYPYSCDPAVYPYPNSCPYPYGYPVYPAP